ncbi:MAG: DHHA1 domain-containing protein, partial [Patescibacteria group bacterium]
QALFKKHKEANETLPNGERHEAVEKWSLDMAAIASVADMVPLLGESRTLTKYGLIVLNKTRRIGLQKLLLEARLMEQDGTLKKEISAETISFQLAPRINAAGRMNHASVAYNLMVTKDPLEATDLAFELNKNNQDRQRLSEELSKEATAQVAGETASILFAMGKGWPIGLVGLIAGKLKEKFQKPAIVMTTHENEITGSGRSIDAFNMIGAFQSIPECFVKFGGHPMACGFTVENLEKAEEFKQKLLAEFAKQTNGVDVSPTLAIDADVRLDDVTWELYDVLEKFAPFGQANPKPRYAAFGLTVVSLKSLGKDKRHLSLFAKHDAKIKKFIGWNLCNGSEEGCVDWSKEIKAGDTVDIVFEISVNEWNGNRELQLTIVDIKKSEQTID